MKANELRVGNYVTTDLHGIGKVESISGVKILYDRNYDSLNIDKTDPIQLTEEWLLMLGFVKGKVSSTLKIGSYINSYESKSIEIWFNDEGVEILINDDIEDNDNCLFYTLKHIKYVHQLQNLYYALTGEELSVK